jgi:hypothetical protein
MGVRGPAPYQDCVLRSTVTLSGFACPVSSTVLPYLPSSSTPSTTSHSNRLRCGYSGSSVNFVVREQRPNSSRHLFASAVITSMRGFRASMRANHDPGGGSRRLVWRTSAAAPMMSRRRMSARPSWMWLRASACRRWIVAPAGPTRSSPRRSASSGAALPRRSPPRRTHRSSDALRTV